MNWRQGVGVLCWGGRHRLKPHTIRSLGLWSLRDANVWHTHVWVHVCECHRTHMHLSHIWQLPFQSQQMHWRNDLPSADVNRIVGQSSLAAMRFMMPFRRSKGIHQLWIACWFLYCFLNHFLEGSSLSFFYFKTPFMEAYNTYTLKSTQIVSAQLDEFPKWTHLCDTPVSRSLPVALEAPL